VKEMKMFCYVLAVLLAVVGKAFSYGVPPSVLTIYSGSIAPAALWSDVYGNIYGCEPEFHSVFKITAGGSKTDFAGTRGTSGVATEGVLAANALFNTPRTVWGDDQFLYVTDSVNNRIRRISWATSLITTIVGGGAGAILTSGEFLGTSVALTLPNAMAGSSNGKLYFADFGHVYLLVPETGMVGMVSFIAGGGDRIGTFAHGDKVALSDVQGLAVDPTNQFLFVADSGNKVVRKMDLTTSQSIIFAGRAKKENFHLPNKSFENGETAYKVKFGNPSSVWVNQDGHVFIADSHFHTISVVRHDKIFLFAGKWSSEAISGPLTTGPADHVDIEASYIFGDSNRGVLYLSDKTRGGIQEISPLAVNAYEALITKTNFDAVVKYTNGIWTDAKGNVYVIDGYDPEDLPNSKFRILKQSPSGIISTFAGKGTWGYSGDGGLALDAEFFYPVGLWGDNENLYFTDNHRIRVINFATNIITTVAGGGDKILSTTTQPAKETKFTVYGLWGDGRGNIYGNTGNAVFLFVVSAGTVELVAYSFGGTKTNQNDVSLLELRIAGLSGDIAGDATRNCLYISEVKGTGMAVSSIIRKLDLNTKRATIFAGKYGFEGTGQYIDGVLATTIKIAPKGLWVADDGTVFVAHNGIISAIDPVSQIITWVAGTWGYVGDFHFHAINDVDNTLNIGGLAKLGKIGARGVKLYGNSALNKLYVMDQTHVAVRLISPISAFLVSPSRRRLAEEEHFSPEKNNGTKLQIRSSNLRGSV
jgi:sugar lactone lactonase YvrE